MYLESSPTASTEASPTSGSCDLRQRKNGPILTFADAVAAAAPGEPSETISPAMVQDEKMRTVKAEKLVDFIWTKAPISHSVRRRYILEKYPEIEDLYGNDPTQAIGMLLTTAVQFLIAYWVSRYPTTPLAYFLITFFVSGTLNHSLFAALHEASHQTVFQGKLHSELLSIILTLPTGLPAAIPFKRYHLDHHIWLAVEGMDPDLPTTFEANFFRSIPMKLLWILLLPLTYSLRPMLTRPKDVVRMDIVNWIATATVDIAVLYFWGWKSLGYLVLGCFFSMNFHPFAGHFISEHFVFPGSDAYQETNSYYGKWNAFTYNVGYHNEHHDFPRVPGSFLPDVRRMGKEFYSIPDHKGWFRVMWAFILNPHMTCFNRVHRSSPKGGAISQYHQPNVFHSGDIPFGGSHSFWPSIAK